jgi:hypothetical protein
MLVHGLKLPVVDLGQVGKQGDIIICLSHLARSPRHLHRAIVR